MENTTDDGKILFTETADTCGYVVRELLETKNENMRYQVGFFAFRPMRIPVYALRSYPPIITHHVDGSDVRVFLMAGYGPTLANAMMHAERNSKAATADRIQASRMLNELVAVN
jgi:hypothetical protein